MKGSSSGNPFSIAQYCPAGTPQENLAQSTKDLRKGLHQSSLSGMPIAWEKMQPIPSPRVSSSWIKRACGYLLSWAHYCDRAIIINSLRHHQRHPQHEAGEENTSGVFYHHFPGETAIWSFPLMADVGISKEKQAPPLPQSTNETPPCRQVRK